LRRCQDAQRGAATLFFAMRRSSNKRAGFFSKNMRGITQKRLCWRFDADMIRARSRCAAAMRAKSRGH
jgi:hypothetical protein